MYIVLADDCWDKWFCLITYSLGSIYSAQIANKEADDY